MNIEKIVKEQRKYFNEFNTRDINSRINAYNWITTGESYTLSRKIEKL